MDAFYAMVHQEAQTLIVSHFSTSMTLLLSWFLFNPSWYSGSWPNKRCFQTLSLLTGGAAQSEWTLCWVYMSLHHSSLPIPSERLWQAALLWRHAPIFLPNAGSLNGAQIAGSDPELQEDRVLWYGSHADGGGEVFSDGAVQAGKHWFLCNIRIHARSHTQGSLQQHAGQSMH